MLKKFTFLLGFTTLFFLNSWSQKATLKGKVLDEQTKEPIPFLNISIEGTSQGTATDFEGNYELSLDPGTHTIVFSSVDYGKVKEKVTLKAGEVKKLDLFLELKAVEIEMFVKSEGKFEKKLDEVTVSLEVLKPNIIQNKNATSADQSLQQVPGVTIVDSEPQIRAGSGYSFGAGSRVMVLVDDIPLLSGDAGRPSWGFIPIENIEQIEVIKGASSVLYGSAALNGVINVRTAYPKDKPLTKITSFMGIYDLPDTSNWAKDFPPFGAGLSFLHSRKIKNFDLVVGGNLFTQQGYIGPPAVNPNSPVDTISFGEYDYRARINFNTRYRFAKVEGLSIGLNGNFLRGNSAGAFLWQNNTSGIFRAMKGAITKTLQTTFNIDPYVSYVGKKGSNYNLRLRYYYLDNNNDNNQGNQSDQWFGEFQYQKRFLGEKAQANAFLKNFIITAGTMTTFTIGNAQLFAGQAPNPPGVDSVVTEKIYTTNFNQAVYAQLENKFFGRLTVSLGARLEYFRIGKFDRYKFYNGGIATPYDTSIVDEGIQPVFRGGLNFKAAEYTFIRASLGQGYRFPTIAERFINTTVGGVSIVANPSLKPEFSWSTELGIKQGFKIGKFMGYADLAGFYQEYENYIEFNFTLLPPPISNFGFVSLNTGRARVLGADFSIMGGGNFTKDFGMNILAGYNYALPQTLSPNERYVFQGDTLNNTFLLTSSDTTNHILKYRFQHTVKVDVEFNYKMFSLGFSLRYNSFMQNIDRAFTTLENFGLINGVVKFRNENNLGDYVMDLRLACQVSKSSRLSFIINNIANRVYVLRPGKVEAPRQFLVQYAYQF
ncbi:MAG: TonB-dependent receptor [Flavobacteriales bacterium]|nr:TonB-dependent receptor [Flavobacteriales bacterium]